MAEPIPIPAFAPALRVSSEEGGTVVGSAKPELGERGRLGVVVADETSDGSKPAVIELDVGEDAVVGEVGKWPFSHSIVPPRVAGSLPTLVMTDPVVKAAVIVSVAGGHSQGSPLVMVAGRPVSLQATLSWSCQ